MGGRGWNPGAPPPPPLPVVPGYSEGACLVGHLMACFLSSGPLDRPLHPLHSSLDTGTCRNSCSSGSFQKPALHLMPTPHWAAAACPPPAGLCLRWSGPVGSRAHVGLRRPTRGQGWRAGSEPGVRPLNLSRHTQKGTLVAGRPAGVQTWRGSGGSEKEPVRTEAQGRFSGASCLPTGPQPPGEAGSGPHSLLTAAGGARPQGPHRPPAWPLRLVHLVFQDQRPESHGHTDTQGFWLNCTGPGGQQGSDSPKALSFHLRF